MQVNTLNTLKRDLRESDGPKYYPLKDLNLK